MVWALQHKYDTFRYPISMKWSACLEALKIWIFGLNGRHHLDEESDIAIFKSLKISEQNIEAPIAGLLQIFNLVLRFQYPQKENFSQTSVSFLGCAKRSCS